MASMIALLRFAILASAFAMALGEGEVASPMAVAIAATLLGAIAFQMGLMYITNHSDDDMRKYSYEVINATISIFSAVLLFQTFNDLLETYVLEGTSLEFQAAADFLHMLVWFSVLQLALAWISGAIGGKPQNLQTVDLNMKCFAVLLAHLAGFASINAWGSLQQLGFFSASPAASFAVLPISAVGQLVLQRITDTIRYKVAMADDGKEDEFEKLWDEHTEEAENDVMSLTLSFNATQALRFLISGRLPNQEGQEPWGALIHHSDQQISQVCLASFVCVAAMVAIYIQMPLEDLEEEDVAEETSTAAAGVEEGCQAVEGSGETEEHVETRTHLEEVRKRVAVVSIDTLSMTFAWCAFFGTKMYLAQKAVLQDQMLLSVAQTMVISAVAFMSIRVLDLVADADWTGEKVDAAVVQIIKAIAILVGFSWEQCFDQAVDSLSSALPMRHLAKMFMALISVTVIVPAWKWWIMPMALRDGWKFGFVIDHNEQEKWGNVVAHLKEKHHESMKSRAHGEAPAVSASPRHLTTADLDHVQALYSRREPLAGESRELEEMRLENQRLQRELDEARFMLQDQLGDSGRGAGLGAAAAAAMAATYVEVADPMEPSGGAESVAAAAPAVDTVLQRPSLALSPTQVLAAVASEHMDSTAHGSNLHGTLVAQPSFQSRVDEMLAKVQNMVRALDNIEALHTEPACGVVSMSEELRRPLLN